VQKGRAKAVRVRLAGRPKQTVRVEIVALTTSGKKVVDRRAYRTCAKKRPRR
jgi:hypothetical protein